MHSKTPPPPKRARGPTMAIRDSIQTLYYVHHSRLHTFKHRVHYTGTFFRPLLSFADAHNNCSAEVAYLTREYLSFPYFSSSCSYHHTLIN